ncbi:MAG TPA: polysaccharide biosynthesis tyrosine autokinase [Tepidisphaeraceae bacterium]|jgi:capsular exopolysaccharide synthesis family protein
MEIAWRRKGLVIFVLFSAVLVSAVALILVEQRVTAEARVLVARNGVKPDAPAADRTTFLNTQVQLIKSATVLAPAVDAPGVEAASYFGDEANKVSYLKERLEVEPIINADVLSIRLASNKPVEAQTIVNAVATAYVSHVADQRKNVSVEAYDRITSERQKLDAQRSDSRKLLNSLQLETGSLIGSNDPATSIVIQKVKQLSDAVTAAQLESGRLKVDFEQALATLGWKSENYDTAKVEAADVVSPQSLDLLKNNLAALNQQLIEAKRKFVPTHPAVRTIQAQIRSMQLSQVKTLKVAMETSQAKEKSSREILIEQEQLAQNLNAKAVEIVNLQQVVATLDKQISSMDERLNQLTLAETVGFTASQLEDAQILEGTAVPNAMKTMALASVIGLVLGLMSALVREWVSPSLGAVHRIADTVGVPVLGSLPRLSNRSGKALAIVTQTASDSEAADAFRSIRTSMLFGAGRCASVAVTSSSAKDGKTTLAANLAISLAQSGKRVVLVDANFREPSLHSLFDMDNAVGFAGVLNGDDLESSLRRTAVEHLDVLTSGQRTTDVSEQLNSPKFTELLRDLNLRYDHVFFDTSAVIGSNDARVIAASCDQTLLVVRGERSNRFATTTARDALLSVGANLMGIVVNDAQNPAQAFPPAGERRDPTDRTAEMMTRLRSGR